MPRSIVFKKERRSEKWPDGVVARFVDLQGNVILQQLVPPGVEPNPDAVSRARNRLTLEKNADGSIQGFVEHGKCPLRHGVRRLTPIIEEEFAGLPEDLQAPCQRDPVTASATGAGRNRVLEMHDGCPHIEWLIESRKARAAERRAQRSAKIESMLDIEKKKLEAVQRQAEAAVKTNEKIMTLVEQSTQRRGKPNAE